jgi:hypothetical protein
LQAEAGFEESELQQQGLSKGRIHVWQWPRVLL